MYLNHSAVAYLPPNPTLTAQAVNAIYDSIPLRIEQTPTSAFFTRAYATLLESHEAKPKDIKMVPSGRKMFIFR